MNQSSMMDFEIVTFWGKFWVRKGIMKWISIILFWTTVMIFGTWLWEYGLILVAPVDFEIITWFDLVLHECQTQPGGQDGHLNHACVLWLFCSGRLDFQKDNLDDFLFPCKWASQREKQVSLALLGRGEGQTHMTTFFFAVTGWNLPLVELENELENN